MDTTKITYEKVESAVRRLPAQRLKTALLFIEFLEQLTEHDLDVNDAEDTDLWAAVLAHESYKQTHLNEPAETYSTAEEFLNATGDR
jgi:hypothetical protein